MVLTRFYILVQTDKKCLGVYRSLLQFFFFASEQTDVVVHLFVAKTKEISTSKVLIVQGSPSRLNLSLVSCLGLGTRLSSSFCCCCCWFLRLPRLDGGDVRLADSPHSTAHGAFTDLGLLGAGDGPVQCNGPVTFQ